MRLIQLRVSVLILFFIIGCSGSGADTSSDAPPPAKTTSVETAAGEKSPEAPPKPPSPKPSVIGKDAKAHFGVIDRPRISSGAPLLAKARSPQSVVLVVIDTLTASHLSSYGYNRKTTPSIDALADEGLLFSNYVSNAPWTRPSYTTIITGLPKSDHQVELGGAGLSMDITTLAERFRAKGYKTAAFVGNPLVREVWGFAQGYQVYKDTQGYQKAFPYDGHLVDDALEWLDSVGSAKHFTTIFMTAPHAPYRPPRARRKFLKTVTPGPVNEYPFREYRRPLPKAEHERIVAAYDDEILYADLQVGRIVNYLKTKGAWDRTTLVVTADHGEMMGEHNSYGHGYHMWEENLRVPLVMHSANIKVKGAQDDTPHTHVDLAPSLLTVAGLDTDLTVLPGISLFDPSGKENDRIRFSQYNAHGIRRQATRDNRYKVIHYNKIEEDALLKLNSLRSQIPTADPKDLPSLVASLEGERFELYDLVTDPKEQSDIFEQRKDAPEIRQLLEVLLSSLNTKAAEPGKMSEELIEALKNAGYFVTGDD